MRGHSTKGTCSRKGEGTEEVEAEVGEFIDFKYRPGSISHCIRLAKTPGFFLGGGVPNFVLVKDAADH